MGVARLAKSGVRLNVEHQATEQAPVGLDEGGGVSRSFHTINAMCGGVRGKNSNYFDWMNLKPDLFSYV